MSLELTSTVESSEWISIGSRPNKMKEESGRTRLARERSNEIETRDDRSAEKRCLRGLRRRGAGPGHQAQACRFDHGNVRTRVPARR